jgi:hypothetical protein
MSQFFKISTCLAFAFLLLVSCQMTPVPAPGSRQTYKDAAFTEFFRRTSGWVAGDGALSVPLADGRVLWLFGDSHIDDYDKATGTIPCLFQVRNTALIHNRKNLQDAETLLGERPGSRSLFKHTDAKLWYWPVSGFQEKDIVFVYLIALRSTGAGGNLGFEAVGNAWAKMKFPEMTVAAYSPLPSFDGIDFGCGFVRDQASGNTYAFGSKRDGIESKVYVARFKSSNPESDWSVWDGKAWNANVSKAAVITRGASTSVSVCKIKGKYLLVTSEFSIACDQGNEIYTSTSTNPTGPFTSRKSIFTLDDTYQGHLPFFYLPAAHPEFINDKKELLITYSINNYEPCVKACVKGRSNPDHYRPKAIRVPLEMIDPEF